MTRAAALGTTALLLAGMCLTACTGGDKPGTAATTPGAATGTGSSATSSETSSVKSLVQELLAGGERPPAIASASADVQVNLGVTREPVALTAEVVELRADAKTTLLHWRLKSTSGTPVKPYGNWLAAPRGVASNSTAELTLLDTPANQRLQPFLNATGDFATNCVCSLLPTQVDSEGVDLYASFSTLGATTQTVDLVIPQFPVIKGIQVTRS